MNSMQHILNELWEGARAKKFASIVQAARDLDLDLAAPRLPEILVDEHDEHVLSVPIPEDTEQTLYIRKPGRHWVEFSAC